MAKPYGQKFWDRIDRYPPVLLRLLARVPKGRPLTTVEVSQRSGIPLSTVDAISRQTDWKGIDVPTARAFMLACNTDLANRGHCRRIWMYLKAQPRNPARRFAYLRRSPEWQTYYLPLLELFAAHLQDARRKVARSETANDGEAKPVRGPQNPD